MTRRTWLVSASTALLGLGDFGLRCRAAEPTAKEARDAAVLEAVFVDLLDDPESEVAPRRGDRRQLRYATEQQFYAIRVEDVLKQRDVKQWMKLSPDQLDLARQAGEHLARRIAEKDGFTPFSPTDKRVVPYTPEQDAKDKAAMTFPRPQVFRASAPGYADDGTVAMVRVRFSWSGGRHGASATYVLMQQKGVWKVLVRDIIYHL